MTNVVRMRIGASLAATALLAACGAPSDEDDLSSAAETAPATNAGGLQPLDVAVVVGEPFEMESMVRKFNATITVTKVEPLLVCDGKPWDYPDEKLGAIEFEVSVDASQSGMRFGSPNWFRERTAEGMVRDDVTVGTSCDDHPDFTDGVLQTGEKSKGWVFFENVPSTSEVLIQDPGGFSGVYWVVPMTAAP